ncbi:uncharacterized protein LOC123263988 [Cotesia glomerata]|uniref:uncharacterized protein LOC123263988 n=1 Tax=Cotesia glomerata TaxID=32391 RepID=UPI001D01E1AE|nr:uncharacterized protein LOC123263988 [Cotesia glomerata]
MFRQLNSDFISTDGSLWTPKTHDYICSDHFIGGQKSDIESSPSYIPTKFPTVYKSQKVNELMVTNRFKRLMDRRQNKNASSALNPEPEVNELQEMIIKFRFQLTYLYVC